MFVKCDTICSPNRFQLQLTAFSWKSQSFWKLARRKELSIGEESFHRMEKDDKVIIFLKNRLFSELSYLVIIQIFWYLVVNHISKYICKLSKLNLNLFNYLNVLNFASCGSLKEILFSGSWQFFLINSNWKVLWGSKELQQYKIMAFLH